MGGQSGEKTLMRGRKRETLKERKRQDDQNNHSPPTLAVSHLSCGGHVALSIFGFLQASFDDRDRVRISSLRSQVALALKYLSEGLYLSLSVSLVSQLFTFGLNQMIIRQSSPEIFGISAVQLELLLSTLLFLSRSLSL